MCFTLFVNVFMSGKVTEARRRAPVCLRPVTPPCSEVLCVSQSSLTASFSSDIKMTAGSQRFAPPLNGVAYPCKSRLHVLEPRNETQE